MPKNKTVIILFKDIILGVMTPVIVAILLLVVAQGDNPYGYYTFLRFAITLIAAYLTYRAYKNDEDGEMFLAFAWMVLVYNPIIPLWSSKDTWNTIDGLTAIYLFVSGLILSYKIYKAK